MKSLQTLLITSLLFSSAASAEIVNVPGVKVFIQDTSAAAAREKAIAQGHTLAFQKALHQLGLDSQSADAMPSPDDIMTMAKGFSPDIEKQTSTSYAASFTFRFDDQDLREWSNRSHGNEFSSLPEFAMNTEPSFQPNGFVDPMAVNLPERQIQLEAPLQNFGDLVAVEKLFNQFPTIRQSDLKSLTQQKAIFELRISGDPEQLRHALGARGWRLDEDEGTYQLTSNFRYQG